MVQQLGNQEDWNLDSSNCKRNGASHQCPELHFPGIQYIPLASASSIHPVSVTRLGLSCWREGGGVKLFSSWQLEGGEMKEKTKREGQMGKGEKGEGENKECLSP